MKAIEALNRLTERVFPPNIALTEEDMDYLQTIIKALEAQVKLEQD